MNYHELSTFHPCQGFPVQTITGRFTVSHFFCDLIPVLEFQITLCQNIMMLRICDGFYRSIKNCFQSFQFLFCSLYFFLQG